MFPYYNYNYGLLLDTLNLFTPFVVYFINIFNVNFEIISVGKTIKRRFTIRLC